MFPRRRTEPWLHMPGLIIIAVLDGLGLLAAFGTTWLEYRYLASPVHLIGAALVADLDHCRHAVDQPAAPRSSGC
jgi:hypothetical protein